MNEQARMVWGLECLVDIVLALRVRTGLFSLNR